MGGKEVIGGTAYKCVLDKCKSSADKSLLGNWKTITIEESHNNSRLGKLLSNSMQSALK